MHHELILVHEKKACLDQTVLAVGTGAKLAVEHRFRIFELLVAGLAVSKLFAAWIRLPHEEDRVVLVELMLATFNEEDFRLLQQLLHLIGWLAAFRLTALNLVNI